MKKIQIGKSSIKSSVIGLGAINFGTRIDEESAFKLMDCYKENGGNLNIINLYNQSSNKIIYFLLNN